MTNEIISLRVIMVSELREDHDLLRQAMLSSALPIEVVVARDAASACGSLGERTDIVLLDAALPRLETVRVASKARGAADSPFTVILAPPGLETPPFDTDALASKPLELEEAKRFLQRLIYVRLPSRALVVDDSSTMRSIVRKTLQATRFPFEITEAGEGFAALQMVAEKEFDIVFLDYNMPGFNGLETLSEFRREKRRMSVVLMTTAQDEDLAERVRAQGAAFLKKPFFPTDIEAVLCRHYGLRALNPKRA
jgi:CheY-like chemotaxis protein